MTRSEPLINGRTRKETAVIDGRHLTALQTPFEQFAAGAIWLLSLAGSLLAFNGLAWPPSFVGVGLALMLQVGITVVEWMYEPRRNRFTWKYGAAVIIGAGTTHVGYRPILLPPLVGVFASIAPLHAVAFAGLPWYALCAEAALLVIAVLIEIAPERILVD